MIRVKPEEPRSWHAARPAPRCEAVKNFVPGVRWHGHPGRVSSRAGSPCHRLAQGSFFTPPPRCRLPRPGLPAAWCRSAGGLRGQMYWIGTRSHNRNSFFFRATPAFGHRWMVGAGRRCRLIFLVANRLGPDSRLDECRNRRKNTPLARGDMYQMAGHYLAQCPKRLTQSGTLRQSSRTFWHIVHFRPARLGTMCFCSGRFLAKCPFAGRILGTMFLPRY